MNPKFAYYTGQRVKVFRLLKCCLFYKLGGGVSEESGLKS
jgi:hypothetical protein